MLCTMKTMIKKEKPGKVNQPRKFKIDCYPYIFSNEEMEILEQKGHQLRALAAGTQKPRNNEERMFVKVCKGQREAFTIMEFAWLKYLNRHEIELKMHAMSEEYEEYISSTS